MIIISFYCIITIKVINQKVKLGQQLESWQLDMQKLLEDQIETKLANNFGLTQF